MMQALDIWLPDHSDYAAIIILPIAAHSKYRHYTSKKDSRIILLPHQNESTLSAWIVSSEAVIIPSLSEGF